jgi:hypothetical protein
VDKQDKDETDETTVVVKTKRCVVCMDHEVLSYSSRRRPTYVHGYGS